MTKVTLRNRLNSKLGNIQEILMIFVGDDETTRALDTHTTKLASERNEKLFRNEYLVGLLQTRYGTPRPRPSSKHIAGEIAKLALPRNVRYNGILPHSDCINLAL